MVKEKEKKRAAKSSSRSSPPPKRQTRSDTARKPASDQTTSTNRQNATSAPQAINFTAKAAQKKSAANDTKARADSKPTQDGKPAKSAEPQPVRSRKRKAELKENDEDPKVSKKQKLIKDKDQNDPHPKTGSRGDVQNANGSKSAATNPLLSTLNAATAQGERDLKATKRSYIRQNEEDSPAVPSHNGRFTPFPSEPPRSGHDDSGNKRQAYQDELQKLEVETRRPDSQARKSERPRRRDERSNNGETGSAEAAAKSPQHLPSTADDETSHDEATARQPPDISSTTGEIGVQPAEPVANDGTSIRQAPETQTTPDANNTYPAILDMNPDSALTHLDILIQTLVNKAYAAKDPTSTSIICIKPSRELERLYRLVLGKDCKSTARHLHEQASLPAAPLFRSLIWACLLRNILNSQLNIPWPSPHRTASLLETYFPQPDEEIMALKHSVRKISLRFMKTEKFLREDLPLQTHSLVHTLYFSLVEHVPKVGGNWKGKDLWEICEAALLFKGICQASGEKVEVFWCGSGDEFDGEKMEREREGEGGEVAFTVRPGLVGMESEGGEEVCLVPARVLLVSEREETETAH